MKPTLPAAKGTSVAYYESSLESYVDAACANEYARPHVEPPQLKVHESAVNQFVDLLRSQVVTDVEGFVNDSDGQNFAGGVIHPTERHAILADLTTFADNIDAKLLLDLCNKRVMLRKINAGKVLRVSVHVSVLLLWVNEPTTV
jgi:hypothetical protein